MQPIEPSADGFYHPADEDEIKALIKLANDKGLVIRVRGSGHSVPASVLTGDFKQPPAGERNINLMLDKMNAVTFDDDNMQVTVQAGCHLGYDPRQPDQYPKLEDSLLYKLDQKGWAVSITGGITRQAVGGFISTGSAGGSLHHSFGQHIVAIRLIDGTGEVREFHRTDDLIDEFYAVPISMGLLGITTAVTLQCVPRFHITGLETTSKEKNCEIDLFGEQAASGKPDLSAHFQKTEYGRCMWWAQKRVNKVVVWQANKMDETRSDFEPKPYREFPYFFGTTRPAALIVGFFFRFTRSLNPPGPSGLLGKVGNALLKPLYILVINVFMASGAKGPQKFWDSWWQGIPMDNQIDFKLLPIEFTEMWFPLEKTTEVTNRLREFFQNNDLLVTGTFAVEIYPAPADNFWLSPGFQQESMRIDLFWIEENKGDPATDFCPQYWELLKDLNFRLHWGKYIIDDPDYLKSQYPRWDEFMNLRARLDPNQVFVTNYWRKYLAIESE